MREPVTEEAAIAAEIARIRSLPSEALRRRWQAVFGRKPPAALSKDLLGRMLVLQNNAELGLELSGLSAGFEAVATASAKFDLSLSLVERRGADGSPAGIEGALEYASDLFDRSSVEAIAGRLVRLLEGAVADPERAIGRLDILGADERHTILREWNATARAAPGATLPELFAAQVARTPDADAVVFEDERLSYGELDARSSRRGARDSCWAEGG